MSAKAYPKTVGSEAYVQFTVFVAYVRDVSAHVKISWKV